MHTFVVGNRWNGGSSAFAFESSHAELRCLGPTHSDPTIVVQSFDATRDIFYKAPIDIPTEYLQQELDIHVPEGMQAKLELNISSLGGAVLIQDSKGTALSPLIAIRALLDRIGTVNSAILQCDNDCMVLMRNAGEKHSVEFSARSIEAFLEMPPDQRDKEFEAFGSSQIHVTGSGLHRGLLSHPFWSNLVRVAPLTQNDLVAANVEGFDAYASDVHRSSLALGAALAYHEMLSAMDSQP